MSFLHILQRGYEAKWSKMADFGGKFQRTRIVINDVEYSKALQLPNSAIFQKNNAYDKIVKTGRFWRRIKMRQNRKIV